MVQNTALQELIEMLKIERLSNPIHNPVNLGLSVAIGLATELLPKERKQIIEAWVDGGKMLSSKNAE